MIAYLALGGRALTLVLAVCAVMVSLICSTELGYRWLYQQPLLLAQSTADLALLILVMILVAYVMEILARLLVSMPVPIVDLVNQRSWITIARLSPPLKKRFKQWQTVFAGLAVVLVFFPLMVAMMGYEPVVSWLKLMTNNPYQSELIKLHAVLLGGDIVLIMILIIGAKRLQPSMVYGSYLLVLASFFINFFLRSFVG